MSGDEYLIGEWQTTPYTSHDRRDDVVNHRVRFIAYDHGADVLLERREECEDDWVTERAWEARSGRVTIIERNGVFSS